MDDVLRTVLPYTSIVGQEKLKLALELAYIAPRIGGVLISGQRGTAKSTTVRAFASMIYQHLPVTIPINATEDRVIGGWQVQKLIDGKTEKLPGLIEEAHNKLLYIDEVNLLDDHIVNIILDVTSTGKLVIQRDGLNEQHNVRVTLVGTMNPEEGGLRPQLLDRFGLMVDVTAVPGQTMRRAILKTVLQFDQALQQEETGHLSPFIEEGHKQASRLFTELEQARSCYPHIQQTPEVTDACVRLAEDFHVEGHRADYLLALASSAYAARFRQEYTTLEGLRIVAELVLRHRLTEESGVSTTEWGDEHAQLVDKILAYVA
jgi:magnesium chelatase subunit I